MDEASIATYIKTVRNARKLQNSDLMERTGYKRDKVDRIINGRQPITFHDVRVFAEALGFKDKPGDSKELQFLRAVSQVTQSVTTDHADG